MSKQKKSKKNIQMPELRRIKARYSIRFYFVVIVFIIIAATAAVTLGIFALLGLVPSIKNSLYSSMIPAIASFGAACIIIGTGASVITSKYVLARIKSVQVGMREISNGNFSVRVEEKDRKDKLSEFGELEVTFNKMASDLDGIELFRNDFINNFSHEFKTPIVSIKGFAKQLQSENLTDEQRAEYVSIIASESERLANMSTNILLLTKLENQQIVSEKTVFSLDEQMRNCIILLENLWAEKNIEFDLEAMGDVQYEFNEEMLSHVWINLITNAINFTPAGGSIRISLLDEGEFIVCAIEDTGIGMSEEVRERIFEKFYQGDRSRHTTGNGIGLNIVKRIIALAGGQISVQSNIDKGSVFTITLPK